jgi:hypothetical protein
MAGEQANSPGDPLELIPPPDAVREMLADSVHRTELLRHLLRIARRKAALQREAVEAEGGEPCRA